MRYSVLRARTIRSASTGQRTIPNTSLPVSPSPTSSMKAGRNASSQTNATRTITAPSVSPTALPRLATNDFGSSSSWATLIPVTRAAIPPDALHKASAIEAINVMDTPARLALVRFVSWVSMNVRSSSGSPPATLSIWLCTSSGSATSPYTDTTAIRVGTKARNA